MKQIGFKNFRRSANMHTLDLGDVNLLVGGNNSGKSTVVKALLLITENLRMLLRDSDYDMFLEERDEDGKRVKKQYRPEFNFAPNILHNALHIGTFERAINVGTSDDYIILSVSYGKINIAVEVARNSNDKNLGGHRGAEGSAKRGLVLKEAGEGTRWVSVASGGRGGWEPRSGQEGEASDLYSRT